MRHVPWSLRTRRIIVAKRRRGKRWGLWSWRSSYRKIVLRYVQGAFFLDFISIIPFGALSFTDIAIFQELQVVRLLRLLRLVKLLRMLRGSRLIMRYRASMTLSITGANLIGFLVVTILASHWLACLWGYAGNLKDMNSSTVTSPERSASMAFQRPRTRLVEIAAGFMPRPG